jgi:hypothetical protein
LCERKKVCALFGYLSNLLVTQTIKKSVIQVHYRKISDTQNLGYFGPGLCTSAVSPSWIWSRSSAPHGTGVARPSNPRTRRQLVLLRICRAERCGRTESRRERAA